MFRKFLSFIKRVFSRQTAEDIEQALIKAAPYVQKVMPVVEQIAAMTPTRVDDEIVQAYRFYGLSELFNPQKDKTVLLRDLAVAVARKVIGDNPQTRYLNLAVEICVGALAQKVDEAQ